MSYEQKEKTGTLFKNDRKQTDKHPDYTGSVTFGGVEFWLSAWIKDGKKGKFMSLSVGNAKEHKEQKQEQPDFDDDLPF